jgi:hypothetical protein
MRDPNPLRVQELVSVWGRKVREVNAEETPEILFALCIVVAELGIVDAVAHPGDLTLAQMRGHVHALIDHAWASREPQLLNQVGRIVAGQGGVS